MKTEVWLRKVVERKGGVYFGEFQWPITGSELARLESFKPPTNQRRHLLHGFHGVYVFSCPIESTEQQSITSEK